MSKRLVSLGDSFTEGVGDDDPAAPNGVRGWADRTAERLGALDPDFRYANLAIRGKLLGQVLAEQLDAALALEPDLVTLYAGGNDLMRPKVDIDVLAVLGVPHELAPVELGPVVTLSARERRAQNLEWARAHAVPWLQRRLRGESSGDTLSPKRPTLEPVASVALPHWLPH